MPSFTFLICLIIISILTIGGVFHYFLFPRLDSKKEKEKYDEMKRYYESFYFDDLRATDMIYAKNLCKIFKTLLSFFEHKDDKIFLKAHNFETYLGLSNDFCSIYEELLSHEKIYKFNKWDFSTSDIVTDLLFEKRSEETLITHALPDLTYLMKMKKERDLGNEIYYYRLQMFNLLKHFYLYFTQTTCKEKTMFLCEKEFNYEDFLEDLKDFFKRNHKLNIVHGLSIEPIFELLTDETEI